MMVRTLSLEIDKGRVMRVDDYEFAVMIGGKPVKESSDRESGVVWIPAVKGQEFDLVVQNRSDDRIEAVISVDGLSVMNGRPGSLRTRGYVLNDGSHLMIPGWRVDDETVARFAFGSVSEGYAARMGFTPRNIGVIACAVFAEAPPPAAYKVADGDGEVEVLDQIDAAPEVLFHTTEPVVEKVRRKRPRPQKTHTDDVSVVFGRRDRHPVTPVEFDRASDEPEAIFEIRYDTIHGLRTRGIGCMPPPGWSGHRR